MKTIKLTAYMDIDDDFMEEAQNWKHHIEYLFDLDSYSEIESVYGVEIEEEAEQCYS